MPLPKKKQSKNTYKPNKENASPLGFNFATVDANGRVPESRIPDSMIAYTIAQKLKRDNEGREMKWSRIYKAYKRFPPTDYSVVVAKNMQGQSNVNFGMMEFIVDNQKSSFYDMVTERNTQSSIKTKKGNDKERGEWSDLISTAFDMVLRQWEPYLSNIEQDLEEMGLCGKGAEFAETREGFSTRSLHNSEILVPDGTYADLTNMGEFIVKRTYTPLEFWEKIKDEETATRMGWNFWACVDVMRYHTTGTNIYQTPTEWLRAVTSNNLNLSQFYDVKINLFEIYAKEYNEQGITKLIILQNYQPIADSIKVGNSTASVEDYVERSGFLFAKRQWAKNWDEIVTLFTDSVGSGLFHEMKGIAERVFVQCRQYDINMNKIVDAVGVNSMLLLKGKSADATKKLRNMQWSSMMILPEDVDPIQTRFALPVSEGIQVMQHYMGDMYRGIGVYQINAPTNKGGQRTKGEAELDAAESAKLSGTQLKRYNACHTKWQRMLYRRLVNCTAGSEGYELKEKFVDFLTKNGVPKEAWTWENIESIESNMLSGAGSPSFKIMAGQKTLEILSFSAQTPGELAAQQDCIAALQGRQNVHRYLPDKPVDIPDEIRVIAFENSVLNEPNANPENARVLPTDNHVQHLKGHFSDIGVTLANIEAQIANPEANLDSLIDQCRAVQLKGGHSQGHLALLARDKSKEDILKTLQQSFSMIEGKAQDLTSQVLKMVEAKQQEEAKNGQGMSESDVKIQEATALAAIRVKEAQDLANIKTGAKVEDHQTKMELEKDKAANQIAIDRAKAEATKLQPDTSNDKGSGSPS